MKHSINHVNIRQLAAIAMLITLTFILERFVPIVNLPTFRITISFIPVMICGMLYGPFSAAIVYGVSDLIGWPIMGLVPIPLVLVSRIVNGFLFGLFLHKENVKFWPHAVTCAFATQIICGAGLTTFGLAHFFGNPFFPLLISRIPIFITYIVLQMAVFPLMLKLRDSLRKSALWG